MSSPIAIPRRASSPARSESEMSSSLTSNGSLYVPFHKRGVSARDAPRSVSPASTSSSWRNHTPANPKAAFNSTSRKAHAHKKPNSTSSNDASKRTHIPAPSHIPSTASNIAIHLPFVYPVADLLALARTPSPLSDAQTEELRAFALVASSAAVPIVAPGAQNTRASASDAGPRRRRVGRARGKSTAQKAATNLKAPADVEVRRARVQHGAPTPTHGSWGWAAHASPEHAHDLESCWRHAPVLAAVTA